MSQKQLLEDPTNRIVTVFDGQEQAEAARKELSEAGLDLNDDQIRVLHGREAAEKVDTSPKWFADTDVEIKRYRLALEAGNTVVSLPVTDSDYHEKIHEILKRHDARLVTHFGEWVTEMLK